MKRKLYVATLLAHLSVLFSLLAPIIRVNEVRMTLGGEKVVNSYYVNIIKFVRDDIYSATTIFMMALTVVHLWGIANALVGIVKREYSHLSINITFICGFASALMGALHLYSRSYALFAICALSFFIISFCSVKLIKSEE